MPLEAVEIRERFESGKYDDHSVHTDSDGVFEFSDISGGLTGCPDVQLHFSKPGYLPVDHTFPSAAAGDTIYLDAAH